MSGKVGSKGYTILGEDSIPSAHHAVAPLLKAAADVLGESYGMDVSVRVNGDGTAGGAWLVTEPGSPLEVDVGIIVRTNSISSIRAAAQEGHLEITADERFSQDGIDPTALAANGFDGYMTYHAHIARRCLKDAPFADDASADPWSYARVRKGSISEALEFLQDHAVLPDHAPAPGPR